MVQPASRGKLVQCPPTELTASIETHQTCSHYITHTAHEHVSINLLTDVPSISQRCRPGNDPSGNL